MKFYFTVGWDSQTKKQNWVYIGDKRFSEIYLYYNIVEIDLDNCIILNYNRALAYSGVSNAPETCYFTDKSVSSYNLGTDDILNTLVSDYLESDFNFLRFGYVFNTVFCCSREDRFIEIPSSDCNISDFSNYFIFRSTVFKSDSIEVDYSSGNSIFSPPDFSGSRLFFITFHFDKSTNTSFICLYFPSDISGDNIKYVVSIYNLKKNFTSCCLSYCINPKKYIYVPLLLAPHVAQ